MAASENLTLIRMLVVLALFVPVMLFGLYHTDVKKHGIFSESARDNEIGKGGKMHIASADELKSEFDPTDAHDAIREIPEDMKLKLMEMGYTEKQVLGFETMSAEQLVHIFDEASTVVHKALKVARRDGTALVLPGLNDQLSSYRKRKTVLKASRERREKERIEDAAEKVELEAEAEDEAEAKRLQAEAEAEAAAAAEREASEESEAKAAEAEAAGEAAAEAEEKEEKPPAAEKKEEAEESPEAEPKMDPRFVTKKPEKPEKEEEAAEEPEKEPEMDPRFMTKPEPKPDPEPEPTPEPEEPEEKEEEAEEKPEPKVVKKAASSWFSSPSSSSSGSGGGGKAKAETVEEAEEETTEVKTDGGEAGEVGSAGDRVVKMNAEQKAAFTKTEEFAKLSQSLTPPAYCYTLPNGDKGQPTVGKVAKGLPSAKAAAKIAEIMAKDRECWFVDKKCANDTRPHLLDGRGRPWINKFKSQDKELADIWGNLPDMAPGSLGTCALVGSADNMLKKGWGKQIDAHDFVVRFNSVLTKFEKDVGTKTDGLWQKPSYQGAIGGKQQPSKYYMIPKDIPKNFEMKNGIRTVAYGPALPKWRKDITEIYSVYKKDKKITKGTPTGGLARMISLMESGSCTRVDIYGFSGGGGKYFKKSAVVKEEHVISVEHYIRRLMMATGLVGKVCVYGA